MSAAHGVVLKIKQYNNVKTKMINTRNTKRIKHNEKRICIYVRLMIPLVWYLKANIHVDERDAYKMNFTETEMIRTICSQTQLSKF